MATTYEPIATTTLGSAASSITFSSIPSTYTDLRVVLVAQGNGANVDAQIQFNSDTGTNYSSTQLYGNGTSAASTRYTSGTFIYADAGAVYSANFCLYTIDVFSYAGSTYKTCLISENGDKNGSGIVSSSVGLWRSTSAINTLKIQTGSANTYVAGTTATLYGIKSA